MKKFLRIIFIISFLIGFNLHSYGAEKVEYLKTDWSFKGLFGKFDRAALQRGYQVYTEVCSSCHSMKYLSYRNLAEKGGPEFTETQAKAIAASFEVKDGPNSDGDMFIRPGKLSDKFVMPYENVKAAQAANGGAYPPDMSVLVKARSGGVDYLKELQDTPVTARNAESYAESVKSQSLDRKFKIVLQQLLKISENPEGKSSNEILEEAETKIFD